MQANLQHLHQRMLRDYRPLQKACLRSVVVDRPHLAERDGRNPAAIPALPLSELMLWLEWRVASSMAKLTITANSSTPLAAAPLSRFAQPLVLTRHTLPASKTAATSSQPTTSAISFMI